MDERNRKDAEVVLETLRGFSAVDSIRPPSLEVRQLDAALLVDLVDELREALAAAEARGVARAREMMSAPAPEAWSAMNDAANLLHLALCGELTSRDALSSMCERLVSKGKALESAFRAMQDGQGREEKGRWCRSATRIVNDAGDARCSGCGRDWLPVEPDEKKP